MDIIRNLYSDSKTDVEWAGIRFHSAILFIYSEPYRNGIIGNSILDISMNHDSYKVLKKILYLQPDINISDDNAIHLYKLLDYLMIKNIESIFANVKSISLYLYLLEKNDYSYKIMKAKQDKTRELIQTKHHNAYIYILEEDMHSQLRKLLSECKDSVSLNNYANMLLNSEGGPGDKVEARRLHKFNWEENKDSDSLHDYAYMLSEGEGGPEDTVEARRLHKFNWEENKDFNSLHDYAYMLSEGEGGPEDKVEARRLHQLNWEENKDSDSLHNYAYMLSNGEGGPGDKVEARRIYKFNWEENKDDPSLNNYAYMLSNGEGGPEDKVEARRLYKFNWEENSNTFSLKSYIHLLRNDNENDIADTLINSLSDKIRRKII